MIVLSNQSLSCSLLFCYSLYVCNYVQTLMKTILAITISAVLTLSGLSAISAMTGTATAKLNCNEEFTECKGGAGNGDFKGGSGGHFELEDGTFTQSGGGGSGIVRGGIGGHTVCDSDGCESHGGGSD
jgi:hypothetical protein